MKKWVPGSLLAMLLAAAVAVGASGAVGAQPGGTHPTTLAATQPTAPACRPSDQACLQFVALMKGNGPAPATTCPSGAAPTVVNLVTGEVRSCAAIPKPGPALPASETSAFQRLVQDVQTVVHKYSSQGVVWQGPAAEQCAQSQACGEAYLQDPTASIIAPNDQVRRAFAVDLTTALANTGAEGVIITVSPDVTFHMDNSCPDIKSNPQCWGQQTISPWQNIGQMRVDFAALNGVTLGSLSGEQVDALYGWSQA